MNLFIYFFHIYLHWFNLQSLLLENTKAKYNGNGEKDNKKNEEKKKKV